MSAIKDQELDDYRSLVEPPGYFEEVFRGEYCLVRFSSAYHAAGDDVHAPDDW